MPNTPMPCKNLQTQFINTGKWKKRKWWPGINFLLQVATINKLRSKNITVQKWQPECSTALVELPKLRYSRQF